MKVAKLSKMTYHSGMSLEAAGAYLQTLREFHGLSRADIASAAGTNEAQVIRIEKGEIDTRGSLLLRFLQSVQGSAEELLRLITSANATAEEGRRAARQAEPLPLKPKLEAMLRGLPDDDLDAVAAIVARLLERH